MAAELETTWPQVLAWRMRRQLLDPVGQPDPMDVVRHLCGVEAQVRAAAALAIGVRLFDDADGSDGNGAPRAGALDAAIERMRQVVSALDPG